MIVRKSLAAAARVAVARDSAKETGAECCVSSAVPPSPSERREAIPVQVPAALLHELRTPLNQIIGFSEMLAEDARTDGNDSYLPDLQQIRTAGNQLLAVITNCLQVLPVSDPVQFAPHSDAGAATKTDRPLPKGTAVPVRATESGSDQGLLLVVDDDAVNRDVLSRRLERDGYAVWASETGQDALEVMRLKAFDLVLLDIMMPLMDGYEVLKALKSDTDLCNIPVVVISALHEMESIVRCIELGADDYLFKPFDPFLLRARVAACLEKKRSRDRETHLFEQVQENYRRLQETEKERDNLTQMIVHDLRTPLTSVISGMLTLEAVGELNGDQREMMNIAVAGGESLLGMINTLLDVEKFESGAMSLDYTMLLPSELIAFAVAQVSSLADVGQMTIIQNVGHGLAELPGDANKLQRVLVNLLGNAIKFTSPGGAVTIGARSSEDGLSVVFFVSDTGEGIPSEAFGRIFEKFGQATLRGPGKVQSTGLGLTFCKLAIEAHGGHIEVNSALGHGSTFSLSIPLRH